MSLPSIADAARSIRSGTLQPGDLVERCLRQIEELEPQVRAWVVVDADGARRAADVAAAELKGGLDRGPLHGIPLGIKDIVDMAGLPTLAGARVRPNVPAAHDAFIVARLREAGAILLGKTVTTEFASFDPPKTRNPWHLERTPGGSSSGSAAATAADMIMAAIGSQTGGSIIRPASYCGVCGLKPTWGRVSLSGIVPLSMPLDHPGPIARSVDDLRLVYRTIAVHDPNDPTSVRREDAEPAVAAETMRPRIGAVGGFFHDRAEGDVRRATADAYERIRAAGGVVENIELPASFAGVVAAHRLVMAVGAAAFHRETFAARGSEYSPRIAGLIAEGLAVSGTDFARALELQLRFRRDLAHLFEEAKVDALAMPAVSNSAPPADTTGEPSFQAPWSFAGLPVVSLPSGLGDAGLPTALQFVGRAWHELPLLQTAAACERAIAFRARPKLLGEVS